MSEVMHAHCEEYLFFFEYIQGNDFGGLLYEDFLEDSFAADCSNYVVYVEELSDGFSLFPEFSTSHAPYCIIDDGVYLTNQFGSTARVYQTFLNVVHSAPLVPIDFCFMSVEVIHGVDSYYEELTSSLHFVPASHPANYVLETIYESLAMIIEPYDLTRDITVKYTLGVNDISNFRHNVGQEYYFNCLAADDYGLFARMSFGYHMFLHSQWRTYSSAYNGIGKSAEDHIMLDDDRAEINWNGMCFASDIVMAFEWLTSHRGYDFTIESTIDGADSVDTYYYMVHLVEEAFSLSALSLSPTERHQFVADVLRTASKVACDAHYRESVGSEIVIDEDSGVAHIMYYSVSDDMIVSGEV